MNQVPKNNPAVLTRLEDHPVHGVLVQFKEPCCPPNTVTFRNSQNNPPDGLLAVVGVHEYRVTVLRESLIACLTAKQLGMMLSIPCTGCYVSLFSYTIVPALLIGAEILGKIYHATLLPSKVSPIIPRGGG